MRMAPRLLCPTTLALLTLMLAACSRDEIRTYKVAKEPSANKSAANPASSMPADHPAVPGMLPPGHPPTEASANAQLPPGHPPTMQGSPSVAASGTSTPAAAPGDLTWTAPAAWQPKALGQMRKGSYSIKSDAGELDLSIFVFPGAAGGTVENINRWRGQVGMAPIATATLADESMPLRTDAGLELIVVDLRGSGAESILGAILPGQDRSWFFKLKGPSALVQDAKPAFLSFLKTVQTAR